MKRESESLQKGWTNLLWIVKQQYLWTLREQTQNHKAEVNNRILRYEQLQVIQEM